MSQHVVILRVMLLGLSCHLHDLTHVAVVLFTDVSQLSCIEEAVANMRTK